MEIPFNATGSGWPDEVHFSFYTEKVPGEGEDSEPLLVVGHDRSMVGVFDGLGGAGGTTYDTPGGRHSGAWFASRVAVDVVAGHLPEIVGSVPDVDGARAAAELHDRLQDALGRRLAEFGAAKSGLRSRLLRALPTTMAVAFLARAEPAAADWVAHAFWAGDSRVYAVDPTTGAHQLTDDDLRSSHDALQNLVDDSVIDNCLSADTGFRINYRRVGLTAPFMVIAASDGCFGYVASPMHFEHLVLAHLDAAGSVDGWRAGLMAAVEAVAGDDATMALVAVGGDFAAVRAAFQPRLEQLRGTYIQPLDDIEEQTRTTVQRAAELRQQRLALRSELWSRYKPDYECFLPEPPTEGHAFRAADAGQALTGDPPAPAEEPAAAVAQASPVTPDAPEPAAAPEPADSDGTGEQTSEMRMR